MSLVLGMKCRTTDISEHTVLGRTRKYVSVSASTKGKIVIEHTWALPWIESKESI